MLNRKRQHRKKCPGGTETVIVFQHIENTLKVDQKGKINQKELSIYYKSTCYILYLVLGVIRNLIKGPNVNCSEIKTELESQTV